MPLNPLPCLSIILPGEWSRESPLPEDERALRGRAEGLCRRLVGCVAASFDKPTTTTATPTSLYGIGKSFFKHRHAHTHSLATLSRPHH